jgi:phosphoribosyl-AMP cyclohydrolase / phosphoribosyl-ATP pyrophosphohydrolase
MTIDFKKGNGLVPAIIQDNTTLQVLMLGFMNEEAFTKTQSEKRVTFFSRTKNKLWTKGETSGNYFTVIDIQLDCDSDTLLIKVNPKGPACHTGAISCFKNPSLPSQVASSSSPISGELESSGSFLYQLEQTISQRIDNNEENSYTNKLFKQGINKVAQKVGEEAVELVIESKDSNDELFKNEAADLLYHFLILLKAKKIKLEEVENVLIRRK